MSILRQEQGITTGFNDDSSGLITFSNFTFVISIIMIVSAFAWLCGLYFVQIIVVMPIEVIELALYGFLTLGIHLAPSLFGNLAYIWGLLFALGITATTVLTYRRFSTRTGILIYFNFVNMLIHAFVGVYLQSKMICFVSVAFFMSLIGFNMGVNPGLITVGYDDKRVAPSATFASAIVTLVGCYFKIISDPTMDLFVPGMLWLGPFVFNVSLLIMSSSYYYPKFSPVYTNMNILTILCGVSAVYFGNVLNISQLYGFGGTFFTIFLLEKYCEIMPNNSIVWAWSTLFFGALLYIINVHMRLEFDNGNGLGKYFHILPIIQ